MAESLFVGTVLIGSLGLSGPAMFILAFRLCSWAYPEAHGASRRHVEVGDVIVTARWAHERNQPRDHEVRLA